MPYDTLDDLPGSVREHLPRHAQEIYRAAYNNAWDEYRDPQKRRGDQSQEQVAHRVAWAAVEQEYAKDQQSGQWKPKGALHSHQSQA